MTISKIEAAKIARAHGLSLADAAALAQFSDAKEAEDAARMFDPAPTQLTREDIASLSPDEIETARVEGRLSDVMGLKP